MGRGVSAAGGGGAGGGAQGGSFRLGGGGGDSRTGAGAGAQAAAAAAAAQAQAVAQAQQQVTATSMSGGAAQWQSQQTAAGGLAGVGVGGVTQQWQLPPATAMASQPVTASNNPQQPTHNAWQLSQQAWGASSNQPSGTYAEQAKKNMGAPMGGRAQVRCYDQPQSWGGLKVDQQTPWDTGNGAGTLHGSDPKGDWGGVGAAAAAAAAAAASRWSVGGAPGGAAQPWTASAAPHAASGSTTDWPPPVHHRHDPTGTAHWVSNAQPHPAAAAVAAAAAMVQGGGGNMPGAGAASWAQPQPNLPAPSDQYDPNPQTPGPWVAPQPAEMNNDMMWHDPNPKQKKVQRDTGTSVWGDPSSQQGQEIKRWKDADMEDYSHVPCAAPSGGDWSQIPVSSGAVSNAASPSCPTSTTGPGPGVAAGGNGNGGPAATGGWGETQQQHHASQQQQQGPTAVLGPPTTPHINDGTERWGAPPQTSAWTSDATSVKVGYSVAVVRWTSDYTAVCFKWIPPMNGILSARGTLPPQPMREDAATLVDSVGTARVGECSSGAGCGTTGAVYSSLMQQIADQLRIAVNKGLIDVSLLSRPLPQTTLIVLNTILQKLSKLEQAQQEYGHVTRQMSSPPQKMESDRLLMEIQGLQTEIMQLRSSISEPVTNSNSTTAAQFMKGAQRAQAATTTTVNGIVSSLTPQDGQSRLNQWKQANNNPSAADAAAAAAATSHADKVTNSASENNVTGLISGTQNMSLDDKIDWKSGTLDWSPPGSTAGERNVANPTTTDSGNAERDEGSNVSTNSSKVTTSAASTAQSANGTPTPPVDDGPQEFVPGKKWEWRDPNKVAEDPNATPGNCKPNPLVSGTAFGANMAQNYLNEISLNKGAYMGCWNGIQPSAAAVAAAAAAAAYGGGANEMWNIGGRQQCSRPPSAVIGQQQQQQPPFGRLPGQTAPGTQQMPTGMGNYATRSSMSAAQQQQQQFQFGGAPIHWVLIQLAGIHEKQVHMVCHKVGQILQFVYPPHSSCVCVKFADPVEAIVARLKAEVPFIQLKVMPQSEMERLMKMSGAATAAAVAAAAAGSGPAGVLPTMGGGGWGATGAPTLTDSAAWTTFGGAGNGSGMMGHGTSSSNDLLQQQASAQQQQNTATSAAQQQQAAAVANQQNANTAAIFHSEDLNRPF
ncbi:unnamed protein product [Anisakis simplex]|uniref:M_domain domain-containing protein n=1 Tax=Anisakis simplex TaxID=6269 RepID=A0A0M3JTR6_ANISI|nr:unnamed protein product [Anisakis simplex]